MRKTMLRGVLLLAIMLTYLAAMGAKSSYLSNSAFHRSSSWSPSASPSAGDSLIIQNGDTVSVESNYSIFGSSVHMVVDGVLDFTRTGARLRLPPGSTIQLSSSGQVTSSGGWKFTQEIDIGSATVYSGTMGTISGPALSSSTVPLPVEFGTIEYKVNGRLLTATWTTHQEVNCLGYYVQFSADGLEFRDVAFVSGAGTSYMIRTYSLDVNLSPSTKYVRIKQIDYDRKFYFTPTEPVKYQPQQGDEIELFPNPSQGVFHYRIPEGTVVHKMEVLNQQGVQVKTITASADQESSIDLGELSKGYYELIMRDQQGNLISRKRISLN